MKINKNDLFLHVGKAMTSRYHYASMGQVLLQNVAWI